MRTQSRWLSSAALVLAGLALGSAPVDPTSMSWRFPSWTVGTASAQETMKFEPVPAESVVSSERRRAERMAREAERRAADVGRVAPAPATPDIPDAPDVPEAPLPPDFSHAGDVVRIGSDIHIEKGQVVEGDVFALRGDILVDGHVKGNVAATGGDVTLGPTARIDGDVMCIGGKLEEADGARVGGQRVTALRGSRTERIKRIEQALKGHDEPDWLPERHIGHLSFALSWLVVWLLVAWAIGKFAPGRTGVALQSLRQEPGLSLMLGLGVVALLVPSVVALALVVAILCITIIGIPLALGVLVAYAGLLVVLAAWGFVLGVIPVGDRFRHRFDSSTSMVRAALWGVLVVSGARVVSELFQMMPLFGWFGKLLWVVVVMVMIVATMMGAGALLRSKFGQGRDARWWPLFPTKPAAPPAPAPAEAAPPPAPPPASPGEPSPAA